MAQNKMKNSPGVYLAYMVYQEYHEDTGLRGMRVAGPSGTPCAIYRMDGGMTTKKVVYAMTRLGLSCEPPVAESTDPNEVLIKSTPINKVPELWQDGVNWLYSSAGTYEYILKKPLPKGSKIKIGVPVYVQTAPPNNTTRQGGDDRTTFR